MGRAHGQTNLQAASNARFSSVSEAARINEERLDPTPQNGEWHQEEQPLDATGREDKSSSDSAYDEAYELGRSAGVKEGFDDGRDEGYDEGYEEGLDEGYRDGYDDGYRDATEE